MRAPLLLLPSLLVACAPAPPPEPASTSVTSVGAEEPAAAPPAPPARPVVAPAAPAPEAAPAEHLYPAEPEDEAAAAEAAGTVAAGIRKYREGDHAGAAAAFLASVAHRREDRARSARFWLARTLLHLDLSLSALPFLVERAEGEPDPDTLRWLAAVADRLEHPGPVLPAFARATPEALAAAAEGQSDRMRGRLLYLAGRGSQSAQQLDAAIERLGAVPPGTDRYAASQFFLGTLLTAREAYPEADAAFVRVIEATAGGAPPGTRDAPKLHALAHLNRARLLYSTAGEDQDRIRDAIDAYARIPTPSEAAHDGRLEAAWVALRLGNAGLASRLVDDVPSAMARRDPEVGTLRALAALTGCDLAAARALADEAAERAQARIAAARALHERLGTDDEAADPLAILERLDGLETLDDLDQLGMARQLLDEPKEGRLLAQVEGIALERTRLEELLPARGRRDPGRDLLEERWAAERAAAAEALDRAIAAWLAGVAQEADQARVQALRIAAEASAAAGDESGPCPQTP